MKVSLVFSALIFAFSLNAGAHTCTPGSGPIKFPQLPSIIDLISAGGIDSAGGGDTVDYRKHTAWFYGDREIKTCFNVIKAFGVSEDKISTKINDSVLKWQTYFTKKQINDGRQHKINTNFKLLGKCKGGEDLVLYFGTGPIFQNLKDLSARQALNKPVAFVNKFKLSADLTWSKGYIRFLGNNKYQLPNSKSYPNWGTENHLDLFIIHELGHVLGFTHKRDTIMTNSIVDLLMIQELSLAKKIDHQKELIRCKTCMESFKAVKILSYNLVSKESSIEIHNGLITYKDGSTLRNLPVINEVKTPSSIPLLSMFNEVEKSKTTNLYYVTFTQHDSGFTLERSNTKLTLKSNGSTIAIFEKEL